MYINSVSHNIPDTRVSNEYFEKISGLTDSWIFERTGIKTRSKAAVGENINTMAVKAVKNAIKTLPFNINSVDLIVGASYSPCDTVATMAHVIQNEFDIDAKAVYISSACSSLINALEIVEGYFATGKSKCALIVASEHNSAYSDETCEKSGHLWGDGASAFFISQRPLGNKPAEVLNITTRGLGNRGKSIKAVYLKPGEGGLKMPDGRDVFVHACRYMKKSLEEVTSAYGVEVKDLDYIIPHQANQRIINNLTRQLKVSRSRVLSNIKELGNTGSASTGICLSQNIGLIESGSLVGLTVFGGGYSAGAALLKF